MGKWRAAVAVFAPVFAIAFAAFLALYIRYPALQDTDSYYHLAAAREIAQHGLPERLEWARFTPMSTRFGDPALLFHVVLAPFASGDDPERGALIALALLDGTIVGLLATLGVAAVGRWGAFLPLVIFLGSTEAFFRLVRLRPELLALSLLMAAAWCAGRGAARKLGVVALLFALSYSAVHAFAGLVLGAFVLIGWRSRRWPWALPLYTLAGLGLGLVLHPRFPANLGVLVDTFRVGLGGSAVEGSGQELGPHSTLAAVFTQLGCWLAALVTWAARTPVSPSAPTEAADFDTRDVLLVFAGAFLALYAIAARFVLFALPFSGLALLWSLRARGERVGAWFPFFGRLLPTASGFGVAALLALGPLAIQAPRFAAKATTGPDNVRIADRRAVAGKLPAGARVAATWGMADLFVFYAPQARYLELLDPSPMAAYFPGESAAKLRVFGGAEPDPVFTTATTLDSEYLLASRFSPEPGTATLLSQLSADPRVEILHDGIYVLARIVPGGNRGFVLDWRVAPEPATNWASGDAPTGAGRGVVYPRPADPRARAVEGYVDLERVPSESPCQTLHTPVAIPSAASRVTWRFAASGPSELWWDDALLLRTAGGSVARLDQAAEGSLLGANDGSPHRLSIRSCRAPSTFASDPTVRRGFYLHLSASAG